MPLRDHTKLGDDSEWPPFHANWAVKIVDRLNESVLSGRYKSKSYKKLGKQAEVDIGTLEQTDGLGLYAAATHERNGGLAVAEPTYAPPAPPLTAEVGLTDCDLFEVRVQYGSFKLVAAVELVSPGNKDRPDARRSFAVKCASYLDAGVALVVVDPVTERSADLHADLCDLLDLPAPLRWNSPTGLSVVAYRTAQGAAKAGLAEGDGRVRLDVWPYPLAVGQPLPTVPLWLAADLAVPLELDRTYEAACRSLRIA